MVYCSKCGKENADDSLYCKKCGSAIKKDKTKPQLEKNINHLGKEMENIGKKIETTFDKTGKRAETWYYKTFGVYGPILSSIIAMIILLIVIRVFQFQGDEHTWMLSFSSFLENYLLSFLIVFLISGYSSYLTKKYKSFRFISPVIGTIVFIFWFWITTQILFILGNNLSINILIKIAEIFEILIIPIAIMILIISYIGLITSIKIQEKIISQKKEEKKDKQKGTSPENEQFEYKRLYRSGKNRIVGGVCGGIAEYFKIDPILIRLLFVLGILISIGTMIFAYIIFWFIVPRNPNQKW